MSASWPRAGASFEKGDDTNAVRYYQQAVKLAPESLDAHLNLANAFLLADDSEGAVEECQRAIELDPNDPAAYYLMGCAYLRQNQPEKAVQAFQQSQKIDPSVDALSFRAWAGAGTRGASAGRDSAI